MPSSRVSDPFDASAAKILFVSNNLGSSLVRISAISIVSIASYALWAAIIRYADAFDAAYNRPGSSVGAPLGSKIASAVVRLYDVDFDKARIKASSVEFFIFVVPLLLSITSLSTTLAALGLSSLLLSLSSLLWLQAGRLESLVADSLSLGDGHSIASEADDDEDVKAGSRVDLSRNLGDHHGDQASQGGPRRRRNVKRAVGHRHGSSSSRNRFDSDEEELEIEAIEWSAIEKERAASQSAGRNPSRRSDESDDDSRPLRVSVESAADQAWNSAHEPESFIEPGLRRDVSLNGPRSRSSKDDVASEGLHSPSLSSNFVGVYNQLDGRKRAENSHDPFLTIYRSHMMLITIACILAVDFPIFHRVLGKCETWGVSLMDLGVGSFVFSLGVISSSSYLKPRALRPSMATVLRKDVAKCLPLVALGLVRVISVKLTAYPEHVTEYGVHWNFFLTLAVLPVLKTAVEGFRRVIGGRWSTWGLCIAFVHQLLLILTPLQRYVLGDTPRTASLLAANREGLVSVPGYLAILLLAVDLGLYILPRHDPYQAFRKASLPRAPPSSFEGHARKPSDAYGNTANVRPEEARRAEAKRFSSLTAVLASWSSVYWAFHFLSAFLLTFPLFKGGYEPSLADVTDAVHSDGVTSFTLTTSRRLANLPYVLWVAAFNSTFLASYAAVYWLLIHPVRFNQLSSHRRNNASPLYHYHSTTTKLPLTPILFDRINRSAFPLFLVSNVLTGLINLTTSTMTTPDLPASAILIVYMAVGCALVLLVLPQSSGAKRFKSILGLGLGLGGGGGGRGRGRGRAGTGRVQ